MKELEAEISHLMMIYSKEKFSSESLLEAIKKSGGANLQK
jgi:hypothetical protein